MCPLEEYDEPKFEDLDPVDPAVTTAKADILLAIQAQIDYINNHYLNYWENAVIEGHITQAHHKLVTCGITCVRDNLANLKVTINTNLT